MAFPTPLTTIFTPPSSCLSTIYYSSGGQYQLGYSTECIPSGPNPTLSSYFSPGLYCPESFTVACTSEVTLGAGAAETHAICCPRLDGLDRFTGGGFKCNTDSAMPWYSSLGCTMNFGPEATEGPITVLMAVSNTIITTVRTVTVTDGLNAYSVKIAYRASDVAPITADSSQMSSIDTSSIPRSASTASTSETSSPLETLSSNSSSDRTGLSTSAKIAIGVAVPIVVLLGALGVFCIIRSRKRRRARMKTVGPQREIIHEKYGQSRSEMDGNPDPVHEIYGTARSELDASRSSGLSRLRLFPQDLPRASR